MDSATNAGPSEAPAPVEGGNSCEVHVPRLDEDASWTRLRKMPGLQDAKDGKHEMFWGMLEIFVALNSVGPVVSRWITAFSPRMSL